jgi:hypothetical protein
VPHVRICAGAGSNPRPYRDHHSLRGGFALCAPVRTCIKLADLKMPWSRAGRMFRRWGKSGQTGGRLATVLPRTNDQLLGQEEAFEDFFE